MEYGITRPTLAMIETYCREANLAHVCPREFFDKYEANGWTEGGEPIRSWTSLIDAWERREKKAAGKFSFVDQRRRTPEEWLDIERRLLEKSDKQLKAKLKEGV